VKETKRERDLENGNKGDLNQGCHLAFKKAKSALFGLFWNSFLEIKWFGHLAFSWPFFNLKENSFFLGLFWLNFNKNTTFYSISKFIWYIFVNFRLKFGLFLAFFWPFSQYKNLAFLKRLMAKFGLF
jgi:hypothetical protein